MICMICNASMKETQFPGHMTRVHGKQLTPLGNRPYVSQYKFINRWRKKKRPIVIVPGSFESGAHR